MADDAAAARRCWTRARTIVTALFIVAVLFLLLQALSP
jgi:hypothetical protein